MVVGPVGLDARLGGHDHMDRRLRHHSDCVEDGTADLPKKTKMVAARRRLRRRLQASQSEEHKDWERAQPKDTELRIGCC